MSGSGRPDSSSPFGDVLGRKRHRHGRACSTARRPCRPSPRTTCRRAIDVQLRLRDREVVEEELRRRRACTMPRSGQVRRRVAHEEVVDVVLAGVHAGRERRPRRRRLGRVRRLQRRDSRPACASVAMCGSLPSAIHFSSRCGSMPSKPRMTSFWLNFDGPRRGDDRAGERKRRDRRTAATRATAADLRIEMRGIITPAMDTLFRDIRLAHPASAPAPGLHVVRRSPRSRSASACRPPVLLARSARSSGCRSASPTPISWSPCRAAAASRVMSWLDFQDVQAQQTAFRARWAGRRRSGPRSCRRAGRRW